MAGGNAPDARWHPIEGNRSPLARLAYDHAKLLATAIERIRSKAAYTAMPAWLLPHAFTLPELQRCFEIVLGRNLEKKAFRTRMLATELLEATDELRASRRRPAQVYRLRERNRMQFFRRAIEGGES